MAEQRFEQMSAFVDGEVSDREVADLMKEMGADEGLKKCWHRYHVIGDALRNNLPDQMPRSLLYSRISDALENEPTVFAPEAAKQVAKKSKARHSATGYAVAASVAIVGFLTVGLVTQNSQTPDRMVVSTVPADAMTTVASVAGPGNATAKLVSEEANIVRLPADTTLAENENPFSPKLRSYVINHEVSASSATRPGLPPSARLVTFSAQQ